jgi:quercetin dioxygenase-like cupin family protein
MFKAIAVAVTLTLASTTCLAQHGTHGHLFAYSKDLKWGDTPTLPGAKLAVIEGPLNQAVPFTMRIRFPANYRIPPHFHSAIEHVIVISGEFAMGVGEKFDAAKLSALKAGDVGIMQPNTAHFTATTVPTEIQVHGVGPWTLTFVNPADDPRKK